ncbi:MAG: alpha/beta hydrolase [Actinomycetota bacterium]|nr:alpha/beta hydrolase [Actinomycetota bacterium]
MGTTWQGTWKWFAAVAALLWAAFGLLWAQVIALPNPFLPPRFFVELLGEVPATTTPERFIVMIFKETSLLLCAFALLGLFLAAVSYRSGARGSSLVAAVLCAIAVVVSLVPTAEARRAAASEDVSLSLPEYFAAPFSAADRPPETATYARPGGEELKLDVWRPSDNAGVERGRPAVVVVHGGGWRSGNRDEFPRWNAWLADQGYVVFDIDYRLSPPPSWQDAPGDVRCAVGWVKENSGRYGVDPGRVALMGRSAGGHLALLTAYTEGTSALPAGCEVRREQDTSVAAVAAFYPPTDLARLSSLGYLGGIDHFLGGSREALPGRYRLSSPVARVDPGDPPTFLVHGGNDEIVPPGESELLAGRLGEAGVPHRLVGLPWANHTFDFFWGGWGSQITRSSLERFLKSSLETPAEAGDEPAVLRDEGTGHRCPG